MCATLGLLERLVLWGGDWFQVPPQAGSGKDKHGIWPTSGSLYWGVRGVPKPSFGTLCGLQVVSGRLFGPEDAGL